MTTDSTITPELLDQLLANYSKPADLTGENWLFKQLKKALIERALGAELTEHLGYEKGDPAGRGSGNSRNGTSSKTILTEDSEMEITVPRDRAGSFEPQLITKGQTRFDGFDDKILSLYPQTLVQTCIVHLIRNSLAFVSWKDRKAILPSIKAIYRAESADAALLRLAEFEAEWGKRYPAIGQIWRTAWEHVVPFFAFAPGIRKMIYTTNAVEALHRSLRKIIKTRGSFPTDEAALKLLYLAIRNEGVHWRRPVEWTAAMGQFAIYFGARFPGTAR